MPPTLATAPTAPQILHVCALDVQPGSVGNGHRIVRLELDDQHGERHLFALAPHQLGRAVEKLVAAAKRLGITFDEHYRALETTPYKNGHHGHTKQLPVIEHIGIRRPPSECIREAEESELDVSAPTLPERHARKAYMISEDDVEAAFQAYAETGCTLAEVAESFDVTAECFSRRFILRYGRDYKRLALAARQQGGTAIATLAAQGRPRPALTKPSGALL